ncbi:MAG: bifunctional 4-hydroxy-2-oxoglutarate aldolase/2-dehydro-3-deoxy-phosphogluconate aldolase [Pseudomonadota bacterium]
MTFILDVPVIGILRGIEASFFKEILHASFSSGLQAIEVTMNTENAAQIISNCRKSVPSGKLLGAGTVRTLDEAKKAADSGAMFFVTPNTDTSVIEYAFSHNIPVIAGAFTPTEVYNAWSAGADMVKVFPCGHFGPQYIKDLLGPFDQIPLVAVGGVNNSNIGDYFKAGVKAVGTSTSLFGKEALENRNIEDLARNVKIFVELCKKAAIKNLIIKEN